ncbi:MAG: acetate--CoA ligase family protein [Calditrichaeota bacterium]|nr:acetate--CoA ligase family protein [Calditrichota bacterium]
MLSTFFNPRGIAIIGASRDPHKLGYGIIRNLVEHHYPGAIYPLNPVAKEILGHKCYANITQVPDPLDLAILIIPAKLAADPLTQCGERGIKHVIVASGGFRETGPQGKALEERLYQIARKYQMRLLGPNCMGVIDTHIPVNTTFMAGMPHAGDIGFLSQSGAMVAAVTDWARGAGVGFSRIVSLGNQVDVNETEMLTAFAEDHQTRVITAYIEGITDGRAFIDTAEKVARQKPVVVLKAGLGKSGAKAVASHTGALAGSAEVYQAAFRQSGVLRARTMEELFDLARGLAWQPLPEGNRVAILTNAGGPGILAVDALEAAGLTLATLSDQTRDYLRARLPGPASLANPVDILAGSGPGTYAIALDALLSDPTVDAALVIQAPQDWFLPASLAEVIGEVAAVHHKPVLASLMGLASIDQALTILHRKRIPNFAFPEGAAAPLAAMVARKKWLRGSAGVLPATKTVDQQKARNYLAQNHFADFLGEFDIQGPPTKLAQNAREAAQIAGEIGYPVALKLFSRERTHKTDIGALKLNLENREAVLAAYKDILKAVEKNAPGTTIEGILVQKMLSGGQEVIVGIRRDPQFGPLVLVGSGGVEVELLRDVEMAIAPIGESQAQAMLDATRAGTRLNGWRGTPPGDRAAVIEVMLRMSQIALQFPEISELEINPLYVLPEGKGAFAVDVRGAKEGGYESTRV